MRTLSKKTVATLGALLVTLPTLASAQLTASSSDISAYQRQGIFDCNQNGSYAMSVGALSAIGGAYVPVADAAVELNTGTLVYKECILREVVDRERESALSAFLKKSYQAIQTSRNGNPQYVVNEGSELLTGVSDPVFLAFLQDDTLPNLNPTLQGPITRALAQNYYGETRLPQNASLVCPYQGDLAQWWSGEVPFTFDNFWAASQPQCDAVSAYYLAQDIAQSRIARAMQYQQDQWNWGRGYYALTDNAQNPLAQRTLTPASSIQSSFQQLLNSPVSQLETANDIGQMIGALYAGITTQVISDTRGLAGLSQQVGGQPSYLDQVAAESSAGVRNAAANVALSILRAAQQIEQAYFQAVNSIAAALTQAIGQLRSAEKQCWDLIIPKVCTSPLSGSNTCTHTTVSNTVPPVTTTITLKVATSTIFSQTIINSQIAPLASSTVTNIQASQKALGLIGNLIAGITNTRSLNAQRVSLQQLDSLVAQRALHTQPDLQNVSQQLANVKDSMQLLVQNTVQNWADGTPNGAHFSATNQTGWCNVNDPTTLATWVAMWKQ